MRSLFIKIFLWFWLASILIIVSTFALFSLVEPFAPVREDSRHIKRMADFGRKAVEILEREGPGALEVFLSHRERRSGRNIFIFDQNSLPVSPASPPPHVRELAERAGKSGVTEFQRNDNGIFMARTIYGPGGKYYIMAGDLPRPRFRNPFTRFLHSRFLSLRLLAIFIVASIFCYWLAWYLTSPARKLRAATRQLASGDLKTRVRQQLGRRKDELAELGHDFDVMAERIECLITSQSRLLRDISHELRSPLARLNVALGLARQRSGKEAEEALDRIEREAGRLNELIGQLLTLTMLENAGADIHKSAVDLDRLIMDIAEDADYEARVRNRGVTIVKKEEVTIQGIEEMLRRAIENVVRNSVHYTREGSTVEISLVTRPRNSHPYAVITVRDHGPGVPEQALTDMFKPFYRVDEARDRKSGGAGIGLAITANAVRLHGGAVTASNADNGGLVVVIELPLTNNT